MGTEETTKPHGQSERIDQLAAALAKAQGQMGAASKDATNPHFKSRYADLASVVEALREPLSANGLAYVQLVRSGQGSVVVTTRLLHASGQWVESSLAVPVAQATAQGVGSAITYGRRYGLSALTGVAAAEDDDDGNAASGRPSPPAASRTDRLEQRVRSAAPPPARLSFGPLRGKTLAELSASQLADCMALAEEKLAESPGAEWAPAIRAEVERLRGELAGRMEDAP